MNPTLPDTTHWSMPLPEFPLRRFKYCYFVSECKARSERSDSERPSEAVYPPLMGQYPKRQHGERECETRSSLCLLAEYASKVTLSPSKRR
jgi:hypothetical protein